MIQCQGHISEEYNLFTCFVDELGYRLDQKEHKLPYQFVDNLVACCWQCSLMKGTHTHELMMENRMACRVLRLRDISWEDDEKYRHV